ncbi:uncharacterized protein LOC123695457 [Colias croceus]|uniref:uncharacterized protein LOC123695457 n=1 Tax=Colias crocea TaxID=72248 RepID=UPI001E27F01B|nr:uncharacterized protein LOC123695457 [Colias croceus]
MNKNFHLFRNYIRIFRGRSFSNKVENVNENEPIKFSTSGAAKARIRPILATPRNMPWYQPFSVVGSVAVFLIYFCMIREESDIDSEFEKTLYDRLKGLEKQQLLISYRFNKENGRSVAEIEQRLKEIEEEEAKLVA